MDLELQKKMFADHVATLRDYGDIKIVDFQKPGSNYYRIRFIFEEDHDRVHISGDLGELIAYNHAGLSFRRFIDYCYRHRVWFKTKVLCSSRPLQTYNQELAEKQLTEKLKDKLLFDKVSAYFGDLDREVVTAFLVERALGDFSDDGGIGEDGEKMLSEIDFTGFWPIDEIGLEKGPDIVDLYLLAFKLAFRQLQEKGVVK